MIMVRSVPTPMNINTDQNPKSVNDERKFNASGLPLISGTDSFKNCNPIKRIANPIINSPHDFLILFLEKKSGKLNPINGRERKLRLTLNPSRAIIHAVMVVPILAPIITPTDAINDSKPALTKLTIITVVADDDWIVVVTRIPVKTPLILLLVIAAKISRILLPATFCNASLMSFIPYRNNPSAPISVNNFPANENISDMLFN